MPLANNVIRFEGVYGLVCYEGNKVWREALLSKPGIAFLSKQIKSKFKSRFDEKVISGAARRMISEPVNHTFLAEVLSKSSIIKSSKSMKRLTKSALTIIRDTYRFNAIIKRIDEEALNTLNEIVIKLNAIGIFYKFTEVDFWFNKKNKKMPGI